VQRRKSNGSRSDWYLNCLWVAGSSHPQRGKRPAPLLTSHIISVKPQLPETAEGSRHPAPVFFASLKWKKQLNSSLCAVSRPSTVVRKRSQHNSKRDSAENPPFRIYHYHILFESSRGGTPVGMPPGMFSHSASIRAQLNLPIAR
jgi:hypothetical protein